MDAHHRPCIGSQSQSPSQPKSLASDLSGPQGHLDMGGGGTRGRWDCQFEEHRFCFLSTWTRMLSNGSHCTQWLTLCWWVKASWRSLWPRSEADAFRLSVDRGDEFTGKEVRGAIGAGQPLCLNWALWSRCFHSPPESLHHCTPPPRSQMKLS